jgi:hypothetical protein
MAPERVRRASGGAGFRSEVMLMLVGCKVAALAWLRPAPRRLAVRGDGSQRSANATA